KTRFRARFREFRAMMRMRAVSNTAAMPRKRADREPLRRRNRPADALRYAERTKATDDQIRRRP
ncbi:MAG: hypothetical protein ACLS6R_05740, partial [Eggerthella lenta]